MRRPEVGETLFSLNVGNAARNCPQVLTPVVVTKVGRKYFTAGGGWQAKQYRFSDCAQKSEYIADSALYESEQEWEDEKEARVLAGAISEAFKHGRNTKGVPLAALRKIHAIAFGGSSDVGE